jgi:DNA-binding beta-propeller fold protein YncE
LVGSGVPAGNGMLVFVDLESREVIGDLDTGVDPMGIAITKDGKHAFVGLMSETYMAYVDLEKRSFEKIPTGNSWNEELAIDDTGTLGILTTGTAGNAMSFAIDMPAMKKGQTVGLTGDAGGVAFFPGTKFAYVLQAPTALTGNTGGYNVLDVSDPTAPKVTDSKRTSGDTGQAYPVTAVPNRKSVVYPSADSNTKKLTLTEVTLDNDKAKVVQTIAVGDGTFSYGLSSSAEGLVLAAVGVEHYVAVVDLNTGKVFSVPWDVTENGPLDIKFIP